MTTYNTTQLAGMASQPFQLPTAEAGYGAKKYTYMTSITYASQASGSVINGPVVPKGKIIESITLVTDTSTSSATLAVGISGTPAKYKAAAAVTSVGVPQSSNLTLADPPAILTADEAIIATVGTASLPSSGILWIIANCVGI